MEPQETCEQIKFWTKKQHKIKEIETLIYDDEARITCYRPKRFQR